jgi:16S rRNA (guanine966-N2)-methyltransferase
VTRIVAGTVGGRRLRVPPKGTRPTSERVREALFSALESADLLDGARVLDLYAGSGALAIEALSRGAASAILVEADARAVSVLRSNLADLALSATVLKGKVAAVLAGAATPVDLVFADPPYGVSNAELEPILAALAAWVVDGGTVVLERSVRDGEPPWPAGLVARRQKRYGDTTMHWATREH